jgi:hypothetical protein
VNQIVAAAAVTQPTAPATCSAGVSPDLESPRPAQPRELAERSDVGERLPRFETIPTVVEFVSAGCLICRRTQPVVAAAERGCAMHGIRVRQLDVATSAGRAAAAERGVLGVPPSYSWTAPGKRLHVLSVSGLRRCSSNR